ncbi:type VII secretion protein EccCa [Microbacterium sp. NPDC012755]|uniref:type VII secretion protein EccCa n=1 Tax=Microbacterium sp. NPDC012755 TaxID=3364184 RepID=UPI00368B1FD8
MNVRHIHRPARIEAPLARPEPRVIAAPPQQGDAVPGGIPLRTLLPVFGSLSSIIMIVVLRANPIMVVVGALVLTVALVGGIGMAVGQRGQVARARLRERERYLDYLEDLRGELRGQQDRARTQALRIHPAPERLAEMLGDPERIWQRRRRDADFLVTRVGIGDVDWFSLSLPLESTPVQPFDSIMVGEARNVIAGQSRIAGMPATVPLRQAGIVSVVGDPQHTTGLVRSLIAQLASTHAPEDLQIGLASPPDQIDAFTGFDLLPHALLDVWDGPVSARRVAQDPSELMALVRDDVTARAARAAVRQRNGNLLGTVERPLLLIIDDTSCEASSIPMPDGFSPAQLGITIISIVRDRLHEPSDTSIRLTIDHGPEPVLRIDTTPAVAAPAERVRPDSLALDLFAGFTSRIAPFRLSAASKREEGTEQEQDALDLLGITSIDDLSPARWRPQSRTEFLRVPVAVGDDGSPVHIDLKESAHGGMGPHGICIGATGSGKSEFLRTLILSLALTHGPDDLSMILVDYKGGAAFTPFQSLPHIAGLIDNLADDAQLIQRAKSSLEGEIVRRQRLLKDAGSFSSITDYRDARDKNPDMPALPHLFVVIDEFGELLTAEPDFIDLLLQIGRIGRALGIHLLLASQRIEGGRLRGLDTYLSYRIGLRTFSEQESSVILETPDAFHLPPIPGYGYLKVDTTVYTRFKAAYVSGPVPRPATQLQADDAKWGPFVQPRYNTIEQGATGHDAPALSGVSDGPALLDECVSRLRAGVLTTPPVWLPPLPDRMPLFRVLGGRDPQLLHVPIGVLDEPARQTQGVWELDLTRSGGHFAVVGAPQSGRTTFLRTFAAGIATTHTPKQVTIYGLDLTGSGLSRLEDFPHVGGIATRANREQQLRLLEELHLMIAERERLFRSHRIESLAQFRNKHASGELPSIVSPDVVVLIDGYGLVRTEFENLADKLADLLTRGGSFGLHLVLALTRWSEVTMSLQPLIGNRLELRLNDPTESAVARKLAETIRSTQPGRSLTDTRLFGQIALPTINDVDDDHIGDALTELAKQTAASWQGPAASPIRLLPEDLSPDTMPDEFDEPDRLPIGLRQDTMEPALLDLESTDQHILVLGDAASGKTTFLRQVLTTLIHRHSPEELVIALMEPRSGLSTSVPDDYLGGHANNITKARQLAAALAHELDKRQNDNAPTTLRIVLIVDDYDILSSGGDSPLDPLLPYFASSRDLKFTVILTRPVAGAARALFERAILTVKDTGGTGIILSGERAEGPLWPGVHATHAVPGRATLVRRGQPPRLIQIAHRI